MDPEQQAQQAAPAMDPAIQQVFVQMQAAMQQQAAQQQAFMEQQAQAMAQVNAQLAQLQIPQQAPAQAPVPPAAAVPAPAAAPLAAPALPKPPKPNKYDGKNPKKLFKGWVFGMSSFIKASGVALDTENAVLTAVPYLEGTLANWYELQERNAGGALPFSTFQALVAALTAHILPQDQAVEARSRLYNLQQKGAVSGYNGAFNELLLFVPDMAAADQLELYLKGLKSEVKKFLLSAQRPQTLSDAMTRAAEIDNTLYSNRKQDGYGYTTYSAPATAAAHNGPAPMELGATQAGQLAAIRCYNCHEEGHMARDCPRPSGQYGRSNNGNTNRGRGRGRGPRGRGRSSTHRGAPN